MNNTKINWEDILERAAWTFLEGFLVAMPASFAIDMDGAQWKAVLFSGCMAGLSALKTFILELIRTRKEMKSE